MATIEDRRADKANRPALYVLCTDSFMSGWGGAAGGRSLYALACADSAEAETVAQNGRFRSDMQRVRFVTTLTADGLPAVKLGPNDHLAVVDRGEAARWFKPYAFAPGN